MEKQTLGENLVKIRKSKGISQKQLAEMINMVPQTLLKIEKGITNPKTETIDKIVKALDITPNDLHGDVGFNKTYFQLPFARNFRNLRHEFEMSQEEFANKLNMSVDIIRKIEKGSLLPDREKISEICKALNISESELTKKDYYCPSLKELELVDLIKEKNYTLQNIKDICEWSEPIETKKFDSATEEMVEDVITPMDQAKEQLIGIFRNLPLSELTEIYDSWMTDKIVKHINDMEV